MFKIIKTGFRHSFDVGEWQSHDEQWLIKIDTISLETVLGWQGGSSSKSHLMTQGWSGPRELTPTNSPVIPI